MVHVNYISIKLKEKATKIYESQQNYVRGCTCKTMTKVLNAIHQFHKKYFTEVYKYIAAFQCLSVVLANLSEEIGFLYF